MYSKLHSFSSNVTNISTLYKTKLAENAKSPHRGQFIYNIAIFHLSNYLASQLCIQLIRQFRAYLHGGEGPQVGEETCLSGVTRLSI